jgi:hypothetical protein
MFDRTCPSPLYTLNCNITVVKCFFPLTFTFLLLRVDLVLFWVAFFFRSVVIQDSSFHLLPLPIFSLSFFYLLSSISLSLAPSAHMIALQHQPISHPAKVDISLLLKPQDEEEAAPGINTGFPPRIPGPPLGSMGPIMTMPGPAAMTAMPPLTKSGPSGAPKRLQPAHTAESPAKKQSKWSPEEDALIIELRGSGMKWEDISKRLPGRSAISCRLHYQNYLERRSEWDEDKKNKLARLYER